MHPAAVALPVEVRSCTGRGAQETLAQLRVTGGRGSLFSGVKRNGTEQAQGLGLIDLCRQVPNEERWWEPVGRKCSGSLCAGLLIRFHLGLACPFGTRNCSTAVGKVGLPHRAWANTSVLFSGHFSMCSVTGTADSVPQAAGFAMVCEPCLSGGG